MAAAGKRKEREETGSASKDLVMDAIAERAAIEILEDSNSPKMSRTELANSVWQRLDPDLEEKDQNTFARNVRNLTRVFGRLRSGELSQYAAERGTGKNQEILSFAKPGRGPPRWKTSVGSNSFQHRRDQHG